MSHGKRFAPDVLFAVGTAVGTWIVALVSRTLILKVFKLIATIAFDF